MFAAEIFAGGGGLAVGLRSAGVRPVAAVELDAYAAAAFTLNHPDVRLFQTDVRNVSGIDLSSSSPTGELDILAACPPCQGFSSLTSKYRRQDDRNELVWEVGRLASEARPRAIMMENVPGLASRGRPILDALIAELEELGYAVSVDVLQVADYGVPQTRRRLVLLAGLGFSIEMPRPSHNRYGRAGLPRWRTLRDTIYGRASAADIQRAAADGGFDHHDWHVVRKLGAANLERLAVSAPGGHRSALPDAMRPGCHQGRSTGFGNTYGRMEWDRPSSTITAGCLSPSKGRFGHPEELRTISLREAALLQTFPADYQFPGDLIDRACGVVGNALPCLFAAAIAYRVASTIRAVTPWLPTPA